MKIKDRLYLEADDACAVCGIRGIQILTIHHIDRIPSNNEYDNQIVLCRNCHNSHHQGKGLSTKQIKERKRHLIEKTLTTQRQNAFEKEERSE